MGRWAIFFSAIFLVSAFLASIGEAGAASTMAIASTRVNMAGGVLVGSPTITVDSTGDFPITDSLNPFVPPAYIMIDDEVMSYTHTYVAPGVDTTHFYGVLHGQTNPLTGDATTAKAHADNSYVRSPSGQVINNMFDVIAVSTSSGFGTFVSLVFTGRLWTAMWNTLAWNYSFLQGQLIWLKYFIFYPMSIGFVWAIGMVLISLAQGLIKSI